MVPIKNATVRVTATTQPLGSDHVLENPQMGDLSTVSVYFEETTPSEMFQDFGVELKEPAYLMCEIADALKFQPNAKVAVTLKGQNTVYAIYVVSGYNERHFAGNDADHVDVYLDRLQYPVVT